MAKGGLDKHPAKWEVIREWDAWSASHQKEAKMMNGMVFFTHLQKDRPDLLRFPDKGFFLARNLPQYLTVVWQAKHNIKAIGGIICGRSNSTMFTSAS